MRPALMDELPPAAAGRLVEAGNRRSYPAGSFIFHERDEPSAVYVVESGMLRVDRTLYSGQSVLLTIATPGDFVGELSLIDRSRRSATAAALADSWLLVVPANRFKALLATDADLARVILSRVTRRLRALTNQFVEAAAHGASSRVASRLVELMRVTDQDSVAPIELVLPITQEELAQWAGLSRAGAVKGIGELRTAGIIETGRKRMVILDPVALEDAAQDVSR